MKDEYLRKRLDENLLTCVAKTGRANLRLGEAREGILNGAYRVGLWKSLVVKHRDIRADSCRRKETRTWMSRWSDLQSSERTGPGWLEARTSERYFPPNIRVIGDPAKLAYSRPCVLYQCQI